jgi:PPOX class probable FMN-dependent enzyme
MTHPDRSARMAASGKDHLVTTLHDLEALYAEQPYPPALVKEVERVTPAYKALIEAAPFFALATSGPGGLDCSPRGDPAGFVRVLDETTLAIPDRRGNNRIDSLRNLIADPRVALLFLIPGVGETIRVMGTARITTEPSLCASFAINGKVPQSVLLVAVEKVFYQCSKAIMRSKLWDPAAKVERSSLPTPGKILAEISDGKMGGDEHDRAAPERLKATIY